LVASADWDDLAFPKAGDPQAKDEALASAIKHPYSLMFGEQVEVKLGGDRRGRELVIMSARDEDQKSVKEYIRSGTMRIFRADADMDEFTKQGGLHWWFNGKPGKVQFKQPGAIVMVVRDHDDNVRFYTLKLDLRC
jgi:hypothetical protein